MDGQGLRVKRGTVFVDHLDIMKLIETPGHSGLPGVKGTARKETQRTSVLYNYRLTIWVLDGAYKVCYFLEN